MLCINTFSITKHGNKLDLCPMQSISMSITQKGNKFQTSYLHQWCSCRGAVGGGAANSIHFFHLSMLWHLTQLIRLGRSWIREFLCSILSNKDGREPAKRTLTSFLTRKTSVTISSLEELEFVLQAKQCCTSPKRKFMSLGDCLEILVRGGWYFCWGANCVSGLYTS